MGRPIATVAFRRPGEGPRKGAHFVCTGTLGRERSDELKMRRNGMIVVSTTTRGQEARR
ncbi:hypothetical protein C8Q76DRAFT_714584 [Earliella scabrosa]|nr:hypothetical protein C8Q76DRAFT_714584 [Earliella scabrosa]